MWIYLIILLISLTLVYLKMQENSLKRRCESAGIPYFGNTMLTMFLNALRGNSVFEFSLKQYDILKQSGHKLALYTHLGSTTLQVQDPELLKQILVKDFEYFTERMSFTVGKNDYMMHRMLTMVKGDTWKALRTKLSPTFTTGKIKRLFSSFDQSGKKLVKFLECEIQTSLDGEIKLMTAFSKFTADVIASAVCGIDAHVYQTNTPSQFEEVGEKILLSFSTMSLIKLLCVKLLPTGIRDAIGISLIDVKSQDYLSNAIKYSMANRKRKDEKRDDFLQLMLEARDGILKLEENELEAFEKDAQLGDASSVVTNLNLLDDEGIVANCVQFIQAGLDGLQSLLIFTAYALALNQDVQDKLRSEINKALDAKDDGEFTYEVISGIVYLDMVINEVLRRWPPPIQVDRQCVKDYKVPNTEFVLKKGEFILTSVYGMHMDENYFPNSEKFDPERFSPTNKAKINPYLYIPFGQGPRNCIGMRFALIETKVAIAQLVKNFKIQPSPRTEANLKITGSFSLKPKNDVFLSLTQINK